MKQPLKAISLFSGAMGLDLGLESNGVPVVLCLERDKHCCSTIRHNRPDISLVEDDVSKVSGAQLLGLSGLDSSGVVLAGGPPCQSFSSAGNRAALNDPRGNLIFEYFRLVREVRPAAFVFENVAHLLTAALRHRPIEKRPGKRWNLASYNVSNGSEEGDHPPLSEDELSGSAFRYLLKEIGELGYSIRFGVMNAADYGAAQKRIRLVILGFRERTACALPDPTHGPFSATGRPHRTLRDAIEDLEESPGEHSVYTERIASFFRKIPEGGNWRDLSEEDRKDVMGASYHAGGGKTGFMRRLRWDEPCPTLTTKANRKGTALCHPSKIRPLSVDEYARVQGFPDEWLFDGAMNQKYKQIGNAVPVALGGAVGAAVLKHLQAAPQDAFVRSSREDLQQMYHLAVTKLRSYARNRRRAKDLKQRTLVQCT